MIGRLRLFARDSAGTTAAEFALVIPIFLLLTIGTMNVGFALAAVIRLNYATETAARCLSVDTTGICTTANIDSYAKSRYAIGNVSKLNFIATQPACGNNVAGAGNYDIYTGFGKVSIGIAASACYPLI